MNEVNRIHLGRQPFTIAIDAHKILRAYLAEIKEQVGSKGVDVVKEVELRMVELLTERGISGEKVILMDDVTFLKKQLGDPRDFKDEDSDTASHDTELTESTTANKRLFRDTENGMLAGVAAGIAGYFGINVMIVRIIFLITVLAGGWGILLYIILWLVVPEAKTSSERLQMQGKAVTVDSLKEIVERADVQGAADRASHTVGPIVNSVVKLGLKIIGIMMIIPALCAIFAMIAVSVYMELHQGKLFQENFFPVGKTEHVLVFIGLACAALASFFVVLTGVAMMRRKWPIASWATGVILGLLLTGLAVTVALVVDIAPHVRQRVDAAHHSTTRTVQAFTDVEITGNVPVEILPGSSYAVSINYMDNPDISKIKTTVENKKLTIDTSQFAKRAACSMICLFSDYDARIKVYSPTAPTVNQQLDSGAMGVDNGEPQFDPGFKADHGL